MKFINKLVVTAWGIAVRKVTIPFRWVKENPQFTIVVVTAAALIWQNCTIRRQVNLYEAELKAEQKPIIDCGVGEYHESIFLNNQLIVTKHIVNIGDLPAYNITRRSAIRRSPEYPLQHFTDLMNEDSLYRNILLPRIPRIDTLSIEIDTSCGEMTKEEFAYELCDNDYHVYIHFWTEYEDVADRFYVLQQTFELHGRADSTLFWSQYYAIDDDNVERPY